MPGGFPDYQAFEIPVLVPSGGTGHSSLTTNGVLLGAGTAPVTVTAAGAANEVLRVPAAGGAPAFGPLDLSKAASTTGILPVTKGGSGTATPSLVAGTGISIAGSWPNQTVTNTSPASALGDPVTVAHGGTGTATPSLVAGSGVELSGAWPNTTIGVRALDPRLAGHRFAGSLSIGLIEDPYIRSITPFYDSGTIPAGTYHLGVTAYDDSGESWSGNYTVTLTAPGRIEIDWVPVGGATGYYIYLGATFATAYRQATVPGGETYFYNLTSAPNSSGPTAPATNSSSGQARAGLIITSSVPGSPANFFLNVGAAENSQAAFCYSQYYGICASFQSICAGGTPPTGPFGKTELDISLNGDVATLVVGPPGVSTLEFELVVNNKRVFAARVTYLIASQTLTIAESGTATAALNFPSRTLEIKNSVWEGGAPVQHIYHATVDTSNQLELGLDATTLGWISSSLWNLRNSLQLSATADNQPWFLADTTLKRLEFGSGAAAVDTNLYRSGAGALQTDGSLTLGTPLAIASGGTGTATPSLVAGANITITGTWPNNTIALTSPITGMFTVGDGAGEEYVAIDGGAGSLRLCRFLSGGSVRWQFGATNEAEGGSNTGSNFAIYRYDDASAYLGVALYIRRSDSQVGIGGIVPWKALDVNGDVRASLQLISTVAVGTAPLAVTSTTLVTNLNAERVGGTRITNVAAAGQVLVGTGDGTAEWQTP